MPTMTIKNPKTGRNVQVRTWDIDAKDVLGKFRSGEYKSVKDLSWALLSAKHSVAAMERTQDGDSAESNFALSVVENALDWTLGLTVFNFIKDSVSRKRIPKPFKAAVTRGGDVFIIGASGNVYS